MGIIDNCCLICAMPVGYATIIEEEEIVNLDDIPEYQWTQKISIITSAEQLVHNCVNEGEGPAKCDEGEYSIEPYFWHLGFAKNGYGIIFHNVCYKLLQQKFHYNLKFADVCRLIDQNDALCLIHPLSKYGAIAKYMPLIESTWIEVYKHDKWLFNSPLKDAQNQKRIINMWGPLIIRFNKNPPRPSPAESATMFKPGTILIGYDQKPWIVTDQNGIHKWVKYDKPYKNIIYNDEVKQFVPYNNINELNNLPNIKSIFSKQYIAQQKEANKKKKEKRKKK